MEESEKMIEVVMVTIAMSVSIFMFDLKEKDDMSLDVTFSKITNSRIKLLITIILTTPIVWSLTDLPLTYKILMYVLIIMSGYDLRFELASDWFSIIVAILALVNLGSSISITTYLDHVLTMVGMFSLLYVIFYVTNGGIGGADVKLFTALGLFFGYKFTIMIFALTWMCGALFAILMLLTQKKKQVALIPYISMATYITIMWGEGIFNWYFDGLFYF